MWKQSGYYAQEFSTASQELDNSFYLFHRTDWLTMFTHGAHWIYCYYYWGSSSEAADTIVLVAFPIIIIINLLSAAIEVYDSPMNALVKSFEILHTYSGQSHQQTQEFSCPKSELSSATNTSKFEVHPAA